MQWKSLLFCDGSGELVWSAVAPSVFANSFPPHRPWPSASYQVALELSGPLRLQLLQLPPSSIDLLHLIASLFHHLHLVVEASYNMSLHCTVPRDGRGTIASHRPSLLAI
jgi:hypothetical protein